MRKKRDFSQYDFSRVAIIGCPSSGKTVLSEKMQCIMHREAVHLDKLLWLPDWQMMEFSQREKIHDDIINQPQWLMDGMWRSHLPRRFERATLVIFLDYRRRISLRRAVKRRIVNSGRQRQDMAEGCKERLDGYFLKYIWTFRSKVRPEILLLAKQHPDTPMIILKSPRQTQKFLSELRNFYSQTPPRQKEQQ